MSNAGIYDVILTVLLVILMIWTAVLTERYRSIRADLDEARSQIAGMRARTTQVAHARAHHQVPGVEVARTTVRDSDDIPLTGRMSQGVKRVRTNARSTDDDRFLPGSGSSSAQEWGAEGPN